MDQNAFRETYHAVNERFCIYEKSILTNQCGCSSAEKFCIAEREGVHCKSDRGQQQCQEYLDILREQAKFALHTLDTEKKRSLPHGKAIRIQVGGLLGLRHACYPDEPIASTINDIDGLLILAKEQFGDFRELPFSTIMQQVAAYKTKKRAHRRNKDE
ncbi:hypothetical protein BOV90_03595 [Solemya velum gill symbiont]|uniref:Uncharacterized protein n=1 Tax=Solemya velum gill symbiont TaxID=2340 RepID=A0A1T2DSQ2_SOVGS|nr:hypothetical protein [Solemya velum gill symbiont]OOY34068.1 hypothetical protein BOV88_11990 [Solemya velum gill symbiont]OOY36696.1 hypothetical protein BOV89_11245 [Solemya velum gill symbiont]OOY40536.1 hypothetical protein BOV90_03595 [Solemya velum gill symbiont]OOY43720.1 hypothetical protein BOV91_03235 [Solemya velum gill symbiont]OOY46176.1 hypothetical protein BOV93_11055 [Solemya velum gill symbiont]